jgi:guanylate kinase
MKNYPYLKKFLDALKNSTNKINPIYRRQFKELIKVIPIVGSWIETNTIGAVEDSILEERLSNLEMACKRALTTDDIEITKTEIANINNIFFVLIITNQKLLIEQNVRIAERLESFFDPNKQDINSFTPKKGFRFVTISGASSTGKDCILDMILSQRYRTDQKVESFTKFTTRPKRVVDSKYYDFVNDDDFDLLEKSGNIIFPYYKRGFRYGFDKTHLINSSRDLDIMIAIFTHFESLPADRQLLKDHGLNHIAILLTSDMQTLMLRSDSRILDPQDIEIRKRSIEKDLRFIAENQNIINKCFDLIVDNSDRHSKYETYNRIVHKIGLKELELQ